MKRNNLILRTVSLMICLAPLFIVAGKSLWAAFSRPAEKIRVEIDGIDYGPFDRIDGLDQFASNGVPLDKQNSYSKITLSRDFVTDPSLYLWAKNRMSRKVGLKDIHLITEDEHGNIVNHQVLNLCQPLSWSVEATNPSLGGFNETINVAVQKISLF